VETFPNYSIKTALTQKATLWYTCNMTGRSINYLVHLIHNVIVSVLIIGIVGIGTLKADQLACELGCTMNHTKMVQPSCCDIVESNHSKMLHVGIPESHQSSLPCCDGKFCSDNKLDLQEITTNNTSSLDVPEATSKLFASTFAATLNPPQKVFPKFYNSEKIPPIYMFTCVYLI
jgi:hypothetical protein